MGAFGRLLGTPRFTFGDAVFEPPPTKATALLCYLAIKGEWCGRDELVYVFYADSTDDSARANLRQVLMSLRRQPYSSGLVTESRRIRWLIPTDVQALREAIQAEDVAAAGAVYGGALLDGLTLVDAPEFRAWLDQQRDELHAGWRDLLLAHVESVEPARAVDLLRAVLGHDALDEEVLQAYLRVATVGGHSTAALRAFSAFQHNLRDETGLEPTAVTLALAEELERVRASGAHDVGGSPARPVGRRGSSPLSLGVAAATTSFLGRIDESSAAASLLRQRDCRLLTIVGAGGAGKSRLAVQVAEQLEADYTDGRTVVALDSVTVADSISATIATALGLPVDGTADPLELVIDVIGEGSVLIVLDNFEHLLDGAAVCSRLLDSCPHLDLIVTSRERLNLVEEWVLSLGGLTVPVVGSSTEDMCASDSVALFIKRAKQVRHDFTAEADDIAAIAEICRLVEGFPLAIEIAATSLMTMSPAAIADSLAHSIDVLERSTRNVPARHRSMRATLEYSWALLSPSEQVALRDASAATTVVFHGAFSRHLVEGRALLEEAIACLDEREPAHQSALNYLFVSLGHFIYLQYGVTAEFDAAIEHALNLATLRQDPLARMYGLIGLAIGSIAKGDVVRARESNREGLELARVHGQSHVLGTFLLNNLNLEWRFGEEGDFVAVARAAAAETEAVGDEVNAATITLWLGSYLVEHADEEGEALVQDGLRRLRSIGDKWLEPFGLLASRAAQQGDHDKAETLAQKGLVLARRSDARHSTANMLIVLAELASARGDHDVAAVRFAHGYRAALTINHAQLTGLALVGYVGESVHLGELDKAATLLAYLERSPEATWVTEEITKLGEELSARMSADDLAAAVERGSSVAPQQVAAELAAAESTMDTDLA